MIVKISRQQLRKLINEEVRRGRPELLEETVQQLNELYPGSKLGSYLKQGVTKIWEADNLIQKALAEAPEEHWEEINEMHKAIEQVGFQVDGTLQKIMGHDQ